MTFAKHQPTHQVIGECHPKQATNGTMALPSYRNWFPPFFYQHVGFRIARNLD
ncbi:hypothetical protein IQ231_22545 [Cuspidothrix issatschenkoi LEGE 03284]|uniref:hypothetical protein n=1 Tax=Cuspidothrix issatschenkoi TaxID=230752 RepID=UPI00187F63B5|nr:hypothetical protein [Cuspidothrix issatschenkoi]MBE9234345.1 hypothetical protein [Cuspidothrix issatschenkoi LEGE 03284]